MRFFSGASKNAIASFLVGAAIVSITAGSFLTYTQLYQPSPDISAPENFVAAAPDIPAATQQGAVMGTTTGIISFSSGDSTIGSGGVVVLNAAMEPTIELNTYDTAGEGDFKLYRLGRNDVLNYLLYQKTSSDDGWGSSLDKVFQLDRSKLQLEQAFKQQVDNSSSGVERTDLKLPISGTGIWFLDGRVGDTKTEVIIVRSNLSAIVHKGDNTNIFWVQDTRYQNVSDATIELYNLEKTITTLKQTVTNQDGVATDGVNEMLDLAVVSKGDDLTIIPIHLESLRFRTTSNKYSSYGFDQRNPDTTSFMFTDRFLYKPGDTIYYKAIIRTDDDADYSVTPKNVSVVLSGSTDLAKREAIISDLGTVDGSFVLPKNAEPNYYQLRISSNENLIAIADLQVAQFRKPDASVNITTDKMIYQPGETLKAQISGTAFLGQPLRNQEIRYKVYEQKAGVDGDYLHVNFLQATEWSAEGERAIKEGSVKLDRKGKATIELPVSNTTGLRQFWTIHIQYLDGASTAATDAVRALIQPGDFVIEDDGKQPQAVVGEQTPISLKLSKNFSNADVSNIPITARLMVGSDSQTYGVEQDNLSATSDSTGHFSITVTPKQKGSYRLDLETHDKSNNLVKGESSFYVYTQKSEDGQAAIFTITADKKTYRVGETAQVSISTLPEIKTAFISIGRTYSRDFRVIALTDGKATFLVPVVEIYQPNFFIMAGSFKDDTWRQRELEIPVDTKDKNVTVKITPAQSTYGPQETARFDITATDGNGQPVQTDLAFWIFDKALLELHGTYFGGIFENFWRDRYFQIPTNYSYQGIQNSGSEGGGGCFVGDTLITMADGSTKPISTIAVGDQIQTLQSSETVDTVSARVTGTHKVAVGGYLVLNGTLQLTPEHILLVNGQWQIAGNIRVGDSLMQGNGASIAVTSIEWRRQKVDVYNLAIEKYHTFLADDIYVHNEKGDSRSIFKDTAYWNPHVTTDEQGKAQVSVVLPDNLTTWVAAAVSANSKTQVGEGQAEFIVTKNIVTRPILPSFLRVGDQIQLAALINNFTNTKEQFSVTASFTGGQLQDSSQTVTVEGEDVEELHWPTTVSVANEKAAFEVKTQGIRNTALVDNITETLPVYDYGFLQKTVQKIEGNDTFPLQLSAGSLPEKAQFSLEVSSQRYPDQASTLDELSKNTQYVGSLEYLATGISASALMTKYGDGLGLKSNKEAIRQTASKATTDLFALRDKSGIWLDSDNRFNPSETRLAVESLALAQQSGFVVDTGKLEEVLSYLTAWAPQDWTGQVEQQYVFSLFPDRQFNRKKIEDLVGKDPGTRARGVMANLRQGFITSDEAQHALMLDALETETQLSWQSLQFGQQQANWPEISLPTAWVIRGMQAAAMDQSQIVKALDYLHRNATSRNTNYEAMVMLSQATLNYYDSSNQLNPTGNYSISVGETKLAGQSLSSVFQKPQIFPITPAQVATGTQIGLEVSGAGKLFTRMMTTELIKDKNTDPASHHLTITRQYLSTKASGEPTLPGDLVLVQFNVNGLGRGENDIEIDDYLPAGLVAIDESLNNDDFEQNGTNSTYVGQQLTEQGMKLTFSQLFSDTGTYTYKTRVIAQGEYLAPPATVRLTHEPSIWASTPPDKIIIDGKNSLNTANIDDSTNQERQPANNGLLYAQWVIIAVAVGLSVFGIIKRKKIVALIKHEKEPPAVSPPSSDAIETAGITDDERPPDDAM